MYVGNRKQPLSLIDGGILTCKNLIFEMLSLKPEEDKEIEDKYSKSQIDNSTKLVIKTKLTVDDYTRALKWPQIW